METNIMTGQRGDFYLGGLVDPDSGSRTGDKLIHAARDLTTHGVIVGMPGSGKTGLGVVLLEEALPFRVRLEVEWI